MIAAGWSPRYQLIVIEFLQAEPVADRAGLVKVNVARAGSGKGLRPQPVEVIAPSCRCCSVA